MARGVTVLARPSSESRRYHLLLDSAVLSQIFHSLLPRPRSGLRLPGVCLVADRKLDQRTPIPRLLVSNLVRETWQSGHRETAHSTRCDAARLYGVLSAPIRADLTNHKTAPAPRYVGDRNRGTL